MSYDLLSKYYDASVGFDYEAYFGFIKGFLPPKGRGLDVACGSGTLTVMLARHGFEMTGTDASPGMLNEARRKCSAAGVKCLLLEGDLNAFGTNKTYDFIISSCDGLNYVKSEAKLERLLGAFRSALTEDGVLIFDISTLYKAKEVLDGNVFFDDTDDYTLLWTNEYSDGRVRTDVTVFEKEQKYYKRYDESFDQYFYTAETVRRLLDGRGFSFVEYDGETFGRFNDKSQRLLVVARKRG